MDQAISIQITIPDSETAQVIGQHLVEKRLIACAQIEGPILSVYHWEKKIEHGEEWRLVLKTFASKFSIVEQEVLQMHPYDVPQIIATNITQISQEYKNWMSSQIS